jgi:hypothetical protein
LFCPTSGPADGALALAGRAVPATTVMTAADGDPAQEHNAKRFVTSAEPIAGRAAVPS